MATGIESLAGPVSPGDIIMRQEEAPRGAAALLNKMLNKGTRGMYKLPEPDKDMPSFMKSATKNLDKMAQSDTINIMAGELIRQGFDPNMIRQMDSMGIQQLYESTFGSQRDAQEMTAVDPSDFRTILKMIQSGMSEAEIEEQLAAAKFPGNFTENRQEVKTLPTNLKTGPDNPETSLAYITDEEKGILAMLNPGTPHEGPEGIPSYDEGDYLTDIGYTPQQAKQAQERIKDVQIDVSTQEGQEKKQEFRDRTGSDVVSDAEMAARGITDRDSTEFKKLIQAGPGGDTFAQTVLKSDDPQQTFLDSDVYKQYEDLINQYEPLTDNVEFGPFLEMLTKGFSGAFKPKEERLEREDGTMTKEGLMEKIKKDTIGGRTEFFNLLKRFAPEKFYKATGMPATSGNIEDLSKVQFKDTSQIAKDFGKDSQQYKEAMALNRQIDEARMLVNKKKDGQRPQQGGGRPIEKPAAEKEEKDQSEYAGAFDVPGTMMFEGQEVPVGRRFTTSPKDAAEAMQYATQGGFNQLEPFAQYVKRRREFLGEDEDEFFDEDGNVIYSGDVEKSLGGSIT